MKIILHESNQYVLKFVRGEEVLGSLKQFCRQEQIAAGFFHGLGACDYLKLAIYDLKTKTYVEKEFDKDLEIAGLTGNLALTDGELMVHMHGTFSDENMQAIAGHVSALKVAVTCEILMTRFDGSMSRKLDAGIGLKLLD
jgi:predicted DNA-binding protein with PD1-like motif